MKVLALDPAVSTGYCILSIENDTASIVKYGYIEVGNYEYSGDRCINLMDQVHQLIKYHDIEKVCVEDYFFSRKTANGSNVNAAFRTAIHIVTRQLNIPYEILNISLWKKYTAGRSTPTKEQKKKWGVEPAKKLMMQQALWEKHGIRFTNHSISLKTGKPVKFRYDIVDAVSMGIFYCRIYLNVRDIRCDVVPPDDVEFKKNPKVMFTYKE